MAITERTLAVVGQARDALGKRLDVTSNELVTRWARAWDVLEVEYQRAISEIIADATAAAASDGAGATTAATWPNRGQLLRSRRLLSALEATETALEILATTAAERASADAAAAAAAAAGDAGRMVASQLPAAAGAEATLAVTYGKLDERALTSIVARTTQQITALSYPISSEATTAITRELIRGIALGKNSGESARRMVKAVEGKFNGGLTRALVISRTETLDAYRSAAAATDQANRDVLAAWTWAAKLDRLTCPSCWAQHGTRHPIDDPGPLDHQQGRCVRLPTTKTWRELGFDIDEPPSVLPDAQKTFDALSQADQLAIMGPGRLAALRSGTASWGDLSTRRTTAGWRDSFGMTSVKSLTSAGSS